MTQPDRIVRGLYWDRAASWIEGCTPVSEGCRHCWSAAATHMRAAQTSPAIRARYGGLAEKGPDGPRFVGKVCTMEADLAKPLHVRAPTTWCVWNDLFHPAVPDEFRDRAFAVMALSPQHTFLILTKRIERAQTYSTTVAENGLSIGQVVGLLASRLADEQGQRLPSSARAVLASGRTWPLPNVWLGVTVEHDDDLNRPDYLMQTPAAVRYVSLEPLLGAVDLDGYLEPECCTVGDPEGEPYLDWVIVGGETGPGARPMHPDWVRSIRDQCATAGVPFFFKGWGEWGPAHDCLTRADMVRVGRKAAGRVLDGRTHDAMPPVGKEKSP